MATVNALNKLSADVMNSGSDSGSISLSEKTSRNELSEILEKIRLSKSPTPATSSTGSDSNPPPEEVREQQRVLRKIQHETEKASNNILLHVKYLTSPLRLFLKTLIQFMSDTEKMHHIHALKLNDRVKQDLISEWNAKDSFGLKMLVKMYRLYENVFPLLKNHEDFMRHFKPNYGEGHEYRKNTVYYLFNNVMNPGVAHHPNGVVNLEHELHTWLETFLQDDKAEIEEVGFELKDFHEALIFKIAFDLNIYASVVFKKAVSFKYKNGSHMVEEKKNPEDLVKELYNKFNANAVTKVLADQMMYWLTTDEDMSNATRAMKGGKAKRKSPKRK
jgi:hypothetical protein